jgi:Rieske Fe-S protein
MTDGSPGSGSPPSERVEITRRHALGTVAIVGVGLTTLAACSSDNNNVATDPGATSPGTPAPSSASSAPAGTGFTTTDQIPQGSGTIFKDEGVVVTQPETGTFHGFTIVCTHQGCQVSTVTDTINCLCHGSKYSIEDGSVVTGPAPAPLTVVDLSINGKNISKA